MNEIVFQGKQANLLALDKEIRFAIGEKLIGVSIADNTVVVYLADDTDQNDIGEVKRIVESHDSSHLPSLELEVDQWKTKLTQLREADAGILDFEQATNSTVFIEQVARRIARLEVEMKLLRFRQ